MTDAIARIANNLARVRQQIAEAAQRSGRSASDVRLVAVTKYVSADLARQLFLAGCSDLGESRPQELWAKQLALEPLDVHWHLIGHLQRNKLPRTLPLISMLHSVDSERLLAAIQSWTESHSQKMSVLIEVNVSGDTTKHGFAPDQVLDVVRKAASHPWTRIEGLMCMASLEGGRERARIDFARLRNLREAIRGQISDTFPLNELSMGMSDDFSVAIEEGATIVRIGSALFEGVID